MMEKKDPFLYAHQRQKEIVWMSQNTNVIPTTPAIDRAITESLKRKEYNLYPYSKGIIGLRDLVLEDLGLNDFEAMVTFGGTEGLYITARAFLGKGDEVICTDPSYLIIHHFIRLCGAVPVELPVYSPPWKLTPEQVNEKVTNRTKMILLIDPLNPLGSGYSRNDVKAICEIAEEHNLLVIDDITYRDFADSHTLTTEFLPDRTIIAYSVSKNCGLAGMRVGAIAAKKEYVEKLRPYVVSELSVNVLGQRGAMAALKTKKQWMPRVKRITRKNQEHIKKAVDKVDGAFLPVYPAQTNMFVIDITETGLTPEDIQNELLYNHNIFVRAGNYVSKRFGEKFIRVSFSVPENQAKMFAKAFPEVMEELKGKT